MKSSKEKKQINIKERERNIHIEFNRWSVNIEITAFGVVLQYCTGAVKFQPPVGKNAQITISKHLALMTPKGKVGRGMT